jgi:molybdopterin-guanine dinucleotide biosynthesis protein A
MTAPGSPAPTVLGAIVAGGSGRRFGADKAAVLWRGRTLLDHAIEALRPQVAHLVVCGRDHPGVAAIADRPGGVGPLGGLAAALHHAAARGHDAVLCVPVDVHPLPPDLGQRLGGAGAAVFADQRMIGWWPATLAGALDRFVAEGGRAVAGWVEHCGARQVATPPGLVNVNRPEDLLRLPCS